MKRITTPPQQRFERYFSRSSGCWEWTGCQDGRGYGLFGISSKVKKRAYRYSYELYIGEIPKGMSVCHRCDNKLCVNPEHLFVGTHAENMADMVAKGRSARGLGERHARAKLTKDDVREIRSSDKSDRALAKKYGVCGRTIWQVKKRISWKEV